MRPHEELFLFRRLTEELLGPDGPQAISVSWRYQPKIQPAHTQFPVLRSTRRTSTAPGYSGSFRPCGRRGGRGGCLGAKKAVAAGNVSALYVFDPGPDGSLGSVGWIIEARARGDPQLLVVQGVLLTDLARAADFVLPGASYVEKEASYTNMSWPAPGNRPRHSSARRCTRGLADSRERGDRARRAVLYASAAQVRAGIAAQYAGTAARGHHDAQLQQAGAGTALAAGVESVGAVEVGFHVSGPAASERQCRSHGAAPAARCDSAQRSEVTGTTTPPRRTQRTRSIKLVRLGLSLCVLRVLSGGGAFPSDRACAGRRSPAATLTPMLERDGVASGRTARAALEVALPEGLHVQSNKPRDPLLIPTALDSIRRRA